MRKGVKSARPLDRKALEEILSRKDPLQDLIEQAKFMEEAHAFPDEEEDSPTPGFSFGMRMGCVREDAELSVNKMAKSEMLYFRFCLFSGICSIPMTIILSNPLSFALPAYSEILPIFFQNPAILSQPSESYPQSPAPSADRYDRFFL